MDAINYQQTERDTQRMQASHDELVGRIAEAVREDGHAEPLQGLHLYRRTVALEPGHSVTTPSLCVIAQGSKEVLLGDIRYRYDPLNYLLATIELPSVSQILEASRERAYLAFRLELNPSLVG